MRIVQVIQRPQYRGAELFACQLSNHLISQGHEVLMVCLYKGDVDLPFKGRILNLQRPEKKRFFDYSGWKNFSQIIRNFHPDVIQANAADTLKFTASSKFLFQFKIPIIFRNANKMGDFIQMPLKKIINKFYLSQVSFVLSVSKLCRRDFIQTFNYSPKKIKTIEIGVEKNEQAPSQFNLHNIENKKLLVHVGSFVPEKNHIGLINIFSKVLVRYPNTVLLLIGKGIMEGEIKQMVLEKNLSENVFFLGYREDVFNIFRKSHCFVLPSLIEGLPGVILEAMYCNLPVVSYDVGGISEIITRHTGSLVEKDQEDVFADEICNILNSRNTVKVKKAFNLVNKKFINDKIATRFARTYENLVFKESHLCTSKNKAFPKN